MSFPIPSFFKMRRIIAVVLVFFGFFFIGLLHRAFAQTFTECTYVGLPAPYNSIPFFYDTLEAAHQGCLDYAASHGGTCLGPFDCSYPHNNCEKQTPGYINYWIRQAYDNYEFLYCGVDSDPCADVSPSPVDACYSESNINWTDQATCQYSGCKCPDYTGQENYDFETCSVVLDVCVAQAVFKCGTYEEVVWEDVNDLCQNHCVGDEEPHTCDGNPGYQECLSKCGSGNFDYSCKKLSDGIIQVLCPCNVLPSDCNHMEDVCSQKCGGGVSSGKIAKLTCTENSSGEVTSYNCLCRSSPPKVKTCDDLRAECKVPPCAFWCNSAADGTAAVYNCDCSNNPDPDPQDPRDPNNPADNSPSVDPSDPADGNGWLASIKENTDTSVEQGRESNGWLEAVKHNQDDQLDLDGKRNDLVSDMSGKLDGLHGEIDSNVGSDSYIVDDTADYGEEPTEDDLPANEDLDSSFGTFTPSETPAFVDVAESALNSLRPVLSSSVCTFDIVFKYESGLVDIDYSQTFDLCQYESIFNMIGNVLIALASFLNLYKLAFG